MNEAKSESARRESSPLLCFREKQDGVLADETSGWRGSNVWVTMIPVVSIKTVRKRCGISLNELADRTGLMRQTLARAERDGVDPRASTLEAIARALGIPVCELFAESGHERKRRKRAAGTR
jgi:DNA-binding XRE family transcriptional regulator